jgi:hypothetical protein
MATERKTPGRCWRRAEVLLVGCLLGWAGSASAAATRPPTPAEMLAYKPHQEGISYTTLTADEAAKCKVEFLKGQGAGGGGWLLRDAKGAPVRLFFDTTGAGRPNVWSYYKDGAEVYREIDTKNAGKPDQYRWFNSGGSKWGIDEAHDGHIKSWKAISPEEVSQEVVQAIVKKDFARVQALMVSEDEVKTLGLPADMAGRIREAQKGARAKFDDTVAKLKTVGDKSVWLHLETAAPQCLPADQTGSRADIVRHTKGTILLDVGNGKNEWVQTGEMLKVGDAWRLTDAPAAGATADPVDDGDGSKARFDLSKNPALQKLFDELSALDKKPPTPSGPTDAAVANHHLKRADILEKIVAAAAETEREPWVRQLADSLSTAAQSSPNSDTRAAKRLLSLEQQLASKLPQGHNLTAYVTYREMQATYAAKLTDKNAKFDDVQKEWIERLSKFVSAYPKAEDTPDALLQLGMVCEFLNKEVEAKNWYAQLEKNFADKPQGPKAAGAVRRLSLDGQVLKLSGPTLKDQKTPFDIDQMRGKVVVVYYWASWNSQCIGDFAKLKAILDASKGAVELLCVSLDNKAGEAQEFLRKNPAPGTHLYQEGGLEGKMATDYGVMVLPTMFLVNKDGKVANHAVQISNVEEEIKKLTK